ncbi:GNAT family N-acetyltransferase [Lysinibacillus agricola]|uniref:GNAT family N-acetyltransferase n=1 Tax=Lysinibacillus agricola TaxID=2590012 RepID=A0ABX7AXN0_9BACI|nr:MULTISPECIES: GNAT family N-acetyltransferase [Lysinibacillus]KOS60324.1 acetyltransferase [Lysinibacillus sp. FJAT-14222]QQP14619.1 GNAT family N-acetyltransferase [Lysinibacillus agricola]
MKNRQATTNDYEAILNLWDRSVSATHDFLSLKDKEDIKKEIPMYFPHLDVRLWFVENVLIGFSGTNRQHLEMLFLDPAETGKGYGKQIMQQLIKEFNVRSVDVNKDNENAKMFYLKNGFTIVSEEPTDSSGRQYPILHLELK